MRGTITLRKLIDPMLNVNVWSKNETNEFIPNENNSGFSLFDNTNVYPLFFDGTFKIGSVAIVPKINESTYIDNTYRINLNNKILQHYLTYSIGFESPFEFKHYFNLLLSEYMPIANAKYRQLWEYFTTSLPHGFYEKMEMHGGNTQTFNNVKEDIKRGDVKDYDFSGNLNGQNKDDPNTAVNYNFDTPQNISSINLDSPDHMSSADTGKTHDGQRYNINGVVQLVNGIPTILQDDSHPTNKSVFGDSSNTKSGSISDLFNDRYDIKSGYSANDIKTINEIYTEFANIDLNVVNAVRDAFLYIY